MPNTGRTLLAVAVALGGLAAAQARAGDGTDAGPAPAVATPPAAADPQQAQSLPEPPMAAQAQASFVLRGVEFSGVTGVPEAELQAATMVDLVKRFEAGALSARDVLAVIVAGLRGCGWNGRVTDLMTVEIGDSPFAAARLAGELIARAFALPAAGPGG